MQAAVLTAPGVLELVEQPEAADPGPGEALVAVHRVGICGTDYHAYAGRQNFISYPCLLGHELAVEVLALGPGVDRLQVGDLCALMPYVSCGSCGACRRGRTNCCERIQVLGVTRPGGLRERMVVPVAQLFVAPGLTVDQLVLIETLGIGWHAVARAPQPQESVLVLGAGPIGLAVAQAARQRCEQVLLADVAPSRVQFAVSQGLDAVVAGEDLDAVVKERLGGERAALVLDATGNRASMEGALRLAAHGGSLVLVGHTTSTLEFDNPALHSRELNLFASRNATRQDWAEVIDAVTAGALDTSAWVNHRTTLEGVVEDLPRLAADPGGVLKAVVDVLPIATSPAQEPSGDVAA